MKKRFCGIFLVLFMALFFAPGSVLGAGTGTADDPILISGADGLELLRESDKYYKLTGDIDLSGIDNWVPINGFVGTLDGDGYTIEGMNIEYTSSITTNTDYGFFDQLLENSVVKNLHINGVVDVTTTDTTVNPNVGGIAGYTCKSKIINSSFSGSVTGSGGGIICVGGLVGSDMGDISNSYNTADVTARNGIVENSVGGLAGASQGSVTNSYNTGDVSTSGAGHSYIGGLVGRNVGHIFNSYNTGKVVAADGDGDFIGGLTGYDSGLITNSFNAGAVADSNAVNSRIGGLSGSAEDSITNSYYYRQEGSVGVTVGSGTGGTIIPEEQAKNPVQSTTGIDWQQIGPGGEVVSMVDALNAGVNAFNDAPENAEAVKWQQWQQYANVQGGLPCFGVTIDNGPDLYAFAQAINNSNNPLSTDPTDTTPKNLYKGMEITGYGAGATFTLTNDITLPEPATENDSNWEPITQFSGTLDGDGYTIFNLIIKDEVMGERNVIRYFGFIGVLTQTAKVNGIHIKGEIYVEGLIDEGCISAGGIVGRSDGGTITNSSFSGSVSVMRGDENYVGGLVGMGFPDSSITNSYNTGKIMVTGGDWNNYAGGLAGGTKRMTIANCYNTGEVMAEGGECDNSAGGFAGLGEADFSDSYNTGNITASGTKDSNAGGLMGENLGGSIYNCYNTGDIKAENSLNSSCAGGLVPFCYDLIFITNSYNTGKVMASGAKSNFAGGLAASTYPGGAILNSYNTGYVIASNGDCSRSGGLVGSSATSIINCYNSGEAVAYNGDYESADSYVGGLLGGNGGTSEQIVNSYCIQSPAIGIGDEGGIVISEELAKAPATEEGSLVNLLNNYINDENATDDRSGWNTWYQYSVINKDFPHFTVYQQITIGQIIGGTIELEPGVEFGKSGDAVTVIATPSEGYTPADGAIKVYKTDDETTTVDVKNNTFIMPDYPVTVTADFEKIPYQVTVDGGIDPATGVITPEQSTVGIDDTVKVTVTPADYYQLKEGSLKYYKSDDDTKVVNIEGDTFKMPPYPVTIIGEFEKIPYQITIDSEVENGTVTVEEGKTTGTYGEEITVIAQPADYYQVKEIIVYKSDEAGITVPVENNIFINPGYHVTVTAVFEKIPYSITVDGELTGGTVTVDKAIGTFEEKVVLTVTPTQGMIVKEVKVYNSQGEESAVLTSVDGEYSFIMPGFNVTVTATFVPEFLTIDVTGSKGGKILSDGDTAVGYGESKTFTIKANRGYVVKDVIVDGESVGAVETYIFENVTDNHTISAEFVKESAYCPGFDFMKWAFCQYVEGIKNITTSIINWIFG